MSSAATDWAATPALTIMVVASKPFFIVENILFSSLMFQALLGHFFVWWFSRYFGLDQVVRR